MEYYVRFIKNWNNSFGGTQEDITESFFFNPILDKVEDETGDKFIAEDFFINEPRSMSITFIYNKILSETFTYSYYNSLPDDPYSWVKELEIVNYYDSDGGIISKSVWESQGSIEDRKEVLVNRYSKIIVEVYKVPDSETSTEPYNIIDEETGKKKYIDFIGLVDKTQTSATYSDITLTAYDFTTLLKDLSEQLLFPIPNLGDSDYYGIYSYGYLESLFSDEYRGLLKMSGLNLEYNIENTLTDNTELIFEIEDPINIEIGLADLTSDGDNFSTSAGSIIWNQDNPDATKVGDWEYSDDIFPIEYLKEQPNDLFYVGAYNSAFIPSKKSVLLSGLGSDSENPYSIRCFYILTNVGGSSNAYQKFVKVFFVKYIYDKDGEGEYIRSVHSVRNDDPIWADSHAEEVGAGYISLTDVYNIINKVTTIIGKYLNDNFKQSISNIINYNYIENYYIYNYLYLKSTQTHYSHFIPFYKDVLNQIDIIKTVLFLNNLTIYTNKDGSINIREKGYRLSESALLIDLDIDNVYSYSISGMQYDPDRLSGALDSVWYDTYEDTTKNGTLYRNLDKVLKNKYKYIFTNIFRTKGKFAISKFDVTNENDFYPIVKGSFIRLVNDRTVLGETLYTNPSIINTGEWKYFLVNSVKESETILEIEALEVSPEDIDVSYRDKYTKIVTPLYKLIEIVTEGGADWIS